jgi:hypothetical protein
VEGGTVEDDVGFDFSERSIDGLGIRDVQFGVGEGARRVGIQPGLEVAAELTGATGDQRPHRTAGKASSAGFTSQRSSSQRML